MAALSSFRLSVVVTKKVRRVFCLVIFTYVNVTVQTVAESILCATLSTYTHVHSQFPDFVFF